MAGRPQSGESAAFRRNRQLCLSARPWTPLPGYKISKARKSLTLVCVGPVITRSPSALK